MNSFLEDGDKLSPPLSAETAGGQQKLNCANAQGLLRIIQSIPCIAIREELTDEWKNRGIKAQIEYSILTAEMSKANFGLATSEYKNLKGLKSQNLRDHMTDLELIFSMLGEASTKEIDVNTNPIGFIENKKAAKTGGKIAGDARKKLEVKSGRKVVSTENYLPESMKKRINQKDDK